jgi:N-acyl-D-aspartate/D-glutamate deacylase
MSAMLGGQAAKQVRVRMPWEQDVKVRASENADMMGKALKRIAEETGRDMQELVQDGVRQVRQLHFLRLLCSPLLQPCIP